MDDFPRDTALLMAERWLDKDQPDGLWFDEMGLSSLARQNWSDYLCPGTMQSNPCGNGYWSEFAFTPDTNWYMLRGVTFIDKNFLQVFKKQLT